MSILNHVHLDENELYRNCRGFFALHVSVPTCDA